LSMVPPSLTYSPSLSIHIYISRARVKHINSSPKGDLQSVDSLSCFPYNKRCMVLFQAVISLPSFLPPPSSLSPLLTFITPSPCQPHHITEQCTYQHHTYTRRVHRNNHPKPHKHTYTTHSVHIEILHAHETSVHTSVDVNHVNQSDVASYRGSQ